ncbi:MAG TPA: alpha/beta hydrolase [Halobacteriales archaeon]|nr:alpha/beta hydrolase [Halobacteriales archaeon]
MPTVQCNGADLYYEDRGEGRPVVFLHGVMAGLRYFEPQLSGLSDGYRTLALDFRGHGRSEKMDLGHTVPQYARDVRAFLDHLDLEDAILVGWSMGALVAWDYVERFGTDRIAGIVDVDMEPTRFQWDDYDQGTSDLALLREVVEQIQTDHLQLAADIVEPLLAEPPSPELRRTMVDETSRCPPPIKAAILFDCTFRDYRAVLPDLDVPMLVCAGTDEEWRSVASVEYAAELAPDARVEHFEASGHCPQVEEPERFNRAVAEFVESL